MTEQLRDNSLDALLESWAPPVVREEFTSTLLANLPDQEKPELTPKLISFPALFGPGTVMGAAAAVLLLLVIGLAQSSRAKLESDLVELDSHSDEAMSELYRLIHLEGLADTEVLAPEDADTALLLFATGR